MQGLVVFAFLTIFSCGFKAGKNVVLRNFLDVWVESERFRIEGFAIKAFQIMQVRHYPSFHDLDHEIGSNLLDGLRAWAELSISASAPQASCVSATGLSESTRMTKQTPFSELVLTSIQIKVLYVLFEFPPAIIRRFRAGPDPKSRSMRPRNPSRRRISAALLAPALNVNVHFQNRTPPSCPFSQRSPNE